MEGPSIVIFKEESQTFKGKKILDASGNAKITTGLLVNQKITDIKSRGKHFIICFPRMYLRIHFLMFGSYRINENKDSPPRLSLRFKNGELNFYSCSVRLEEGNPDEVYDYTTDVMSDTWNPKRALIALRKNKKSMAGDALLDQEIFAGVGNIIKNEILYRIRLHPESIIENLERSQLKALVKEARDYSFDFYKWKKIFELRKHWLIYKKKKCLQCSNQVTVKHTGVNHRLSFFCEHCQPLSVKKPS